MGLCNLPPEILQQVAGHLADSHGPSLHALSLTCRTCHTATSLFIFRHIHLVIRNRKSLEREIDALVETLSRTNSARHIHRLSLKGFLDINKPRIEKGSWDQRDPTSWMKSKGIDEILPGEELIPSEEYRIYDEPVIERSSAEDGAWAPVIRLVNTLPHLNELVYDCQNQFPPSLLDTLHQRHPKCQLHHLTFRFRTLLWGIPYPYEMALATSPCLYGIKVWCTLRDSDGDDDYNQEALMQLAAGLAPNLSEVVVVNFRPMRSRRYHRPRDRWQDLPGFVPGGAMGSLTSLSLIGEVDQLYTPDLIQAWSRSTDFGSLRHLALGGGEGEMASRTGVSGELMEWISQNLSFPRLKTFTARLDRDNYRVEKPHYGDNAVTFFMAFPPLDEVSVSGSLEPKILHAILSRHGPTLRKLGLRPSESQFAVTYDQAQPDIPMTFAKEHFLEIQAQCPILEDLNLPVQRTQSSAVEVEIYRTLATMEHVKNFFLILDCSDWRISRDRSYRPPFDGQDDLQPFESEPDGFMKKGHARAIFRNSAVDETLARSIWDVISQAKVGKPLESLKLWTTGSSEIGEARAGYDTTDIAENLSRSWLVRRVPRDDECMIEIRELGRRAREERDEYQRDLSRRAAEWCQDRDLPYKEPEAMEIFYSIWPRKEGSTDWREDWSSIPLQL